MQTLNAYKLLAVASFFAVSAASAIADDDRNGGESGAPYGLYHEPSREGRAQNFPILPAAASTIPADGDVNPYGVAFVPNRFPTDGVLQYGDLLVSNFNNNQNLQGAGSSIVKVNPQGVQSLFYKDSNTGVGLTGALGVLRGGLVIAGNLPTADGTAATVRAGSLLVIDRHGAIVQVITDNDINGPWGLAIRDLGNRAQLFVSNVLSGTVVRFDADVHADGILIRKAVQIASGFAHRVDAAALVLGPSGLSYDAEHDTLYAASSDENAVFAIANAACTQNDGGKGVLIYSDTIHLHGPVGLALAPNGHLLTANSDGSNVDPNQPSEIVEFTRKGKFIQQFSVDNNNGGAFGLAFQEYQNGGRFAFVDDNQNNVTISGIVLK